MAWVETNVAQRRYKLIAKYTLVHEAILAWRWIQVHGLVGFMTGSWGRSDNLIEKHELRNIVID